MSTTAFPESKCMISGQSVTPFLYFGMMPIANGFLTPDQFANEPRFELEVGLCETSGMVQLTKFVPPEAMFHGDYAFFSSTSAHMAEHFRGFAAMVRERYVPGENPFVVEMGSNDGIMLRHFAAQGIPHLGIEPSANVAQKAVEHGVRTISEFFCKELGERIADEYGRADAFLGANVMCHIPTLHSVAAGIKKLLKPKGVLIFEDPYLGDIVEKTSYDQIYDEHSSYFSALSVDFWFNQHEMELIDLQPQTTHGGSMRYVIANKGARNKSPIVETIKAKERRLGLNRLETMADFARRVAASRESLRSVLSELNAQGKRVAGYGATSKSTTVLNYCGLGPTEVAFISDTTPTKIGKYSPGVHIPIRTPEEFHSANPDVALLFAWNHANEILAKEARLGKFGGKWLLYVPEVHFR